MDHMLAWLCLLMTAGIATYVLKQASSGKWPLLSIRNVFLGGVVIFQLTSAAMAYFTGNFGELPLSDPTGTGYKYLLVLSSFLILFLACFESNWFTFNIHNRVKPGVAPSEPALAVLAVGCLIAAAVLRLVLMYVPVFGVLAQIMAFGMAAMAAGTAAWVWARRPTNPAYALLLVAMFLGASGLVLYQAFGRREVLSVIIAILWGAYYGRFRLVSLYRAAVPLTLLGMVGFLLVSAFTATRSADKEVPITQTLMRMADADVKQGAFLLVAQDAPNCSLWLLENRPNPFAYNTLHSLKYAIVHPMPRIFWQNKPNSLGAEMVTQAILSDRSSGFTFGPGLVGHLVNDNPWLSVPIYAAIIAAGLRILDNLIRRFPTHPIVILPIGVAMGEVIAMPRGELGAFSFRALVSILTAYFGAKIVSKVMISFGFRHDPDAVEMGTQAPLHEAYDAAEAYEQQ
jgi:hypothetical protein